MTASGTTEIAIPPYGLGPATLITARSYLVDRFTPDCETISLPARAVAGGTLRFRRCRHVARAERPKGIARRIRSGIGRSVRRIDDRIVVDLRLRAPENWAHFLDNHLPLYFKMCETLGIGWEETLVLLPASIPSHIRNAAALFGIEVLATDDDVECDGIEFEVEPWTAPRPVRVDWVQTPAVAAAVDRATAGGGPLPERVFLARSDTRRIENEDEVAAVLQTRGYEKVYPERLSVADQFRLFRQATAIVAVHGAGLAPLLYLPPRARLAQFVEILPCGHMTDVYRVIAHRLGCPWIGVRGRIKPDYVEAAYRLGERFDAFSLDSFEVDVVALERALDIADAARAEDRVRAVRPRAG